MEAKETAGYKAWGTVLQLKMVIYKTAYFPKTTPYNLINKLVTSDGVWHRSKKLRKQLVIRRGVAPKRDEHGMGRLFIATMYIRKRFFHAELLERRMGTERNIIARYR